MWSKLYFVPGSDVIHYQILILYPAVTSFNAGFLFCTQQWRHSLPDSYFVPRSDVIHCRGTKVCFPGKFFFWLVMSISGHSSKLLPGTCLDSLSTLYHATILRNFLIYGSWQSNKGILFTWFRESSSEYFDCLNFLFFVQKVFCPSNLNIQPLILWSFLRNPFPDLKILKKEEKYVYANIYS